MKTTFLIQRTAVYNNADGGYYFEKRYNIHQRINHKACDQRHYHISNVGYDFRQDWTKEQKKNDWEYRCLERGERPFGYPENLWQEYLAEVADEEYQNKCEAKNAWRYEI